jgi:UDP-GlcNAc:undecaprenyl-phosphate GlcNAc-1-phosphate transferase
VEKSLVGLDLRVKITDKGYVYGQFATDDPAKQRYAYQGGVRWFDVIRKDLHLQLEYNGAQPFMYMNDPPRSWPTSTCRTAASASDGCHISMRWLPSWMRVSTGSWCRRRWCWARTTATARWPSNYGSDLGKPDILVTGPDGARVQQFTYIDANVSYLFNPNTNLRAYVGVQRRSLDQFLGQCAEHLRVLRHPHVALQPVLRSLNATTMKEHGYILLLGFITSFLVVLFTMPSLIKVARMKHLVDEPGEQRKVHHRSVPTIGGIIIFASVIFSYALVVPRGQAGQRQSSSLQVHVLFAMGGAYKDFKFVLAAMVLLFFIGVKDDIIGFSPVKKLVGHMVVGYILVMMADIRITDMHGLFGVYELPEYVSIALSFFVYVVLVNAFNLIDGVDGLAGGVGLHRIDRVRFMWLFLAGDIALSLLAFVLAGSLVGFLVFNWHPARIFMGDSGSLIIGAIIAVLAMKVVDHDTSRLPSYLRQIPTPIFAMAVIAYPLVDTLRIFVYRMVRGVSPFSLRTATTSTIGLMDLKIGHRKTTGFDLPVLDRHHCTQPGHPEMASEHRPHGLGHLGFCAGHASFRLAQAEQCMKRLGSTLGAVLLVGAVVAQTGWAPLSREVERPYALRLQAYPVRRRTQR